MSSLTDVDKRYLEKLLAMGGGVVLDYKDAAFGALSVSYTHLTLPTKRIV